MTYGSQTPRDQAAMPLRDDGGKPTTGEATKWLSDNGYDATARPLGQSIDASDIMTTGRRVLEAGDSSDWLGTVAHRHAQDDIASFDVKRVDTDIDARDASLRRFADRHAFFKAAMQPRQTDAEVRRRVAWGLDLLLRTLSEDARAIIAMQVDRDMSVLGEPFKPRRDKLAIVMQCSPTTVHTRITRGLRLWEKVTREVKAVSNEDEPKPLARDTAREAAALTEASKALIAGTLVEIDVRGEIDAIDKADRKASVSMIPHSLMQVLDLLGMNDDATRRMLAAKKPDAREQWCAVQIRAAIAGTPEQRAAARQRCGVHYHALVRECVAQRAKDGKSVKSKRRTEKAV